MIWAANWKVNFTPKESLAFLQEFVAKYDESIQKQTWIFPQNFSIGAVYNILNKTPLQWGSQNIHSPKNGAYTGENSIEILQELGATTCLVGHSERRSIFQEDNALLSQKINMVQENNMCPLYCIGETLNDRESNQTEAVLEEQLRTGLGKLIAGKPLAIAYEPVWAIGTGQVASLEQVEEAHAFIRKTLASITDQECPILYGGSVKPGNAKELGSGKNVDGFLIGGASLKIDDFCQIIEQTK